MLQQKHPNDYVVGTGVGATVRDFCKAAFDYVNLDYENYVKFDSSYIRPKEVDELICDSSQTEIELNWKPSTHWHELSKIMMDYDLKY